MKRHGSLANRLTGWFIVSAFCLVSTVTGILYWSMTRALTHEDSLFMFDKIQTVTRLLDSQTKDSRSLKDRVENEWVERQFDRAYVRVLNSSGKVVTETPGFGPTSGALFERVPLSENTRSAPLTDKLDSKTGRLFKVKAVKLAGTRLSDGWMIQIALDRTTEESLLHVYRSRLLAVLLGTLMITAIVSRRIVIHGIRPVSDIADSAKRIRSTTLHERINVGNLPSELTVLAVTFNEMLDRLNESFDRLAQFSADIAHDLRTPVNNLRGELEVALGKVRAPEEYQDVLGSCLEECDRIAHMIDNLLFLARSENPNEKLRNESINIRQEIQTLFEFFEVSAIEAGVQLKVDVPDQLSLFADRILVQRALGNIISNALSFTKKNGAITVFASEGDELVYIGVTDTGIGIAPEHLPHVFGRLYRVDQVRSSKPTGFGLGLAIVKGIMGLHQGKVEIASQLGAGTTVTLLFPRIATST